MANAEMRDDDGLVASVRVYAPLGSRDDARAILAGIRTFARNGPVTIRTSDLLLRYEAREAGFTGGLRQALRGTGGPPVDSAPPLPPGMRADRLARVVEAMVPGVAVTGRRTRALHRRAISGMPSMIDLTVRIVIVGKLVVVCPDVPDIVPENIAFAVDTVAQIRRRFGLPGGVVDRLYFDEYWHGLKVSKLAGKAHSDLPLIHLNASLAYADGLVTFAQRRMSDPSKRPPAAVASPATYVDAVIAHECWHRIEAAWLTVAYRDTIEFRRRLGEHFGVATLEHAVLGGTGGPPAAGARARAQLASEVSAYATTTPREATAEMFKLWWCAPPSAWSPAVRLFGRLVEDMVPR